MIIKLLRAKATATPAPPSPDYVVDGVTQSHWLAENAVFDGSTVNTITPISSITDSSGVENMLKYTNGGINQGNAYHDSDGWSGDGGPAIVIDTGFLSQVGLMANGWAGRISGVRTPFTITAKMKVLTETAYKAPWGFNVGHSYVHLSPRKIAYSTMEIYRNVSAGSGITYRTTGRTLDTSGHNWYVEYDGSNHRFWMDGIEETYTSTTTNLGNTDLTFTTFNIGGWDYIHDVCSLVLAEMHIYLTAFAEPQRTILINDLQNRRGL